MDLAGGSRVYSSDTVKKDLRDFFHAERKRRGLNQQQVAEAGNVKQSAISKIERDAPYQPSLDIFLRAIIGLGMTPSDFFLQFEQRERSDRTGQIEKTNIYGTR